MNDPFYTAKYCNQKKRKKEKLTTKSTKLFHVHLFIFMKCTDILRRNTVNSSHHFYMLDYSRTYLQKEGTHCFIVERQVVFELITLIPQITIS